MRTAAMEEVLAQLRAAVARASGKDSTASSAEPAGRVDFGAILKGALGQVNSAQQEAQRLARDFARGAPEANLQDVMVSLQKASISFQTMVQVRNRLVAAYHEIMNMQV